MHPPGYPPWSHVSSTGGHAGCMCRLMLQLKLVPALAKPPSLASDTSVWELTALLFNLIVPSALFVQLNRPLSTFVCIWEEGPGLQKDCRSPPLPSLRHFPPFTWHRPMCAQPQPDASGLRKVQVVSSMTHRQDGGDDGTLILGCSPFLHLHPRVRVVQLQAMGTCAMAPSCAASSAQPSGTVQVSFSVFFYG